MASKKTQINNPLFRTTEVDPTMDFDTSYVGPMTRGRTKALAEVYAQTIPILQSSPVFNTSKTQKLQTISSTQGASKDVVGLIKIMLPQPTLSQTSEPIKEAPMVEEENESTNGSDFSCSENILTSKFRDPSHTISSSTMLVMMTNTTSLEKQVLMIAQTLEQLMKPMTEREAARDAQIAFMMNKMGNSSGSNHEDKSLKPKQPQHDIVETSAKGEENSKNLKLFANESISSNQRKELIKEAIKDQVGEGGSQSSIAYANHIPKG